MKALITKSALDALAKSGVAKKRIILWDKKIPMFGVYVTRAGYCSFIYQYRLPGTPTTRRIKLGTFPAIMIDQARHLAQQAAWKVTNGIDPLEERRARVRKEEQDANLILRNFAERYIREHLIGDKLRTGPDVERAIRRDLIPHLGNKSIDKLTDKDLETMEKVLLQRSPSAARSAKVNLKAMLNWAKSKKVMKDAITDDLFIPQTAQRKRSFVGSELQRVWESLHDMEDVTGPSLIAMLRLLRRNREVREMVWEEIDQTTWVWTLPPERTKNKIEFICALPPQVVSLLESQQPNPKLRAGLIFSKNGAKPVAHGTDAKLSLISCLDRRMEMAAEHEGCAKGVVKPFRFYDLRATGSTRMRGLKIPPHVVAAVLHQVSGITDLEQRYQHVDMKEDIDEALRKFNDFLDTLDHSPGAFQGERHLPAMTKREIDARVDALTARWPKNEVHKEDDDEDDDS